eukprot:6655126-Pyramimonas_sp.AAC.1
MGPPDAAQWPTGQSDQGPTVSRSNAGSKKLQTAESDKPNDQAGQRSGRSSTPGPGPRNSSNT